MKILVLADIHSNWAALQAIKEDFDVCLFAGDLVDYAVDPVPCVEWVRKHATVAVRGNHDHAVAQHVAPRGGRGFRLLAAATRPIHWDVLDSSRMKYLARLPVSKRLTVEGVSFHIVHATPHDPMDEYLADDAAAWSERLESIDADFVCVGHTHLPFHLELDRVQVLNPGSVGQPRDGDPRCSYAIIENGRVELRRVAYDIDATLTQMKVAGIPADALDFAETVLKNGGYRPDDD